MVLLSVGDEWDFSSQPIRHKATKDASNSPMAFLILVDFEEAEVRFGKEIPHSPALSILPFNTVEEEMWMQADISNRAKLNSQQKKPQLIDQGPLKDATLQS